MSKMATTQENGSPLPRRSSASASLSMEMDELVKSPDDLTMGQDKSTSASLKKDASVLASSNLADQGDPKKLKLDHEPSPSTPGPMEKKLFPDVTEQCLALQKESQQKAAQNTKGKAPEIMFIAPDLPIGNPMPLANALEAAITASTLRPANLPPAIVVSDTASSADELLRLRRELAQAHSKISRLEEIQRFSAQEPDRVTPGPSTSATSPPIVPPPIAAGFAFGLCNKPMLPPRDQVQSWIDDGASRGKGIWSNQSGFANPYPVGHISMEDRPVRWHNNRQVFDPSNRQAPQAYRLQYESGNNDTEANNSTTEVEYPRPRRPHQRQADSQFAPPASYGNPYGGYNMPPYEPMNAYGAPGVAPGGVGMNMFPFPQQQQPTGTTTLSPHATEFTSNAPWKTEHVTAEGQTFIPSTEPLNYRRLLDRNVTCDWKYIVDKIVCNNDQQASIFLQQKLKVSTPEQKYDIVEAIVAQAYPLMVNRFGNFLVQRCFEHGTPEQVIKIAEAIRGNTLSLSIDPFGCHVVQKAFDSVPEDYKAIMVHELLRRIPETVIHRYACHVWQKLFELRWTESPPQIMNYVNEALRGMWHEVALGETGSLVVQNIFENCLEEDKRPCIEEVLANIDIVAHGQFGNWCIQHICEHGAPADRSRAIDHVIRYAAEYSMDQFASKVVEKCLKISGPEFLSRYLERVSEGRMDRTRIPLIDIASDQYGNYLVQYILTHAQPQHRETVAAHIRKHMVSLRGSKFGSRVGMLCTNPAVATRPGPGIGPSTMGPPSRINATPRYGAPYR